MITAHHGDMLEVIPRLIAEGIVCDAVVTDPPYHLTATVKRFANANPEREHYAMQSHSGFMSRGFMNQHWDGGDIAFRPETWATIATALRPGAFLVAFGGTRTSHRLACAIEDAGFVIQDTIAWLYGSGFPKRRDMLKPAFEPIVLAYKPGGRRTMQVDECRIEAVNREARGNHSARPTDGTASSYDFGSRFAIGKTDLGRWPANVCHDGGAEVTEAFAAFGESKSVAGGGYVRHPSNSIGTFQTGSRSTINPVTDTGSAARFFKACPFTEEDRWSFEPASFAAACSNLQSLAAASVLSRAVARSTLLWELIKADYRAPNTSVSASDLKLICDSVTALIQSLEGASSHGSPPERLSLSLSHAKCVAIRNPTGIITITINHWKLNGSADPVIFSITEPNTAAGDSGFGSRFHYCAKADKQDRWGSRHPTVKPVELMKWLVPLVTPPGGTVIDPFAGSGTTGVAALATGRNAILIEREAQYVTDIRERLAFYEGNGAHSVQARNRSRAADYGPLFAEAR